MSNQENRAVDRVLAGLRSAQAPDGMEQRILQELRARETAAARSPKRGYGATRQPWLAVAAAMLVVAGALLAVHRRDGHENEHFAVKHDAIAAALAARPLPTATAAMPAAPAPAKQRARAVHHVELARSARAEKETARAVSYPAPVEPLTAQEKALVQIAQHPGPAEIAMLDPVVRARQQALEDAQFENFFKRPDQ